VKLTFEKLVDYKGGRLQMYDIRINLVFIYKC